MINDQVSWIKRYSLFLKLLAIILLISVSAFVIINLVLLRGAKERLHDHYLSTALVVTKSIEYNIANDPLGPDYSKKWSELCKELATSYDQIYQINLLTDKGYYLASSNQERAGKIASSGLLDLVFDQINYKQLLEVDLSDDNKIINVMQFTSPIMPLLTESGVASDLFTINLQILFNNNAANTKIFTTANNYLLPIGLLILAVFVASLFLFYNIILHNLNHLSGAKNTAALQKINLDGEFEAVKQKLFGFSSQVQALNENLLDFKMRGNFAEMQTSNTAELYDYTNFRQLILGVRVLNFNKSFGSLNADQFSKSVTQLYVFYQHILNEYKAKILLFNGSTLWVCFKSSNQYNDCKKVIKKILNKATSFSLEYRCSINKKLDFIFFINKGRINLANIKAGQGLYFSALGGLEMIYSMDKISTLENSGIWAVASLQDELKNYFNILMTNGSHKVWGDAANNLICLSLEKGVVPIDAANIKNSSAKTKKLNKSDPEKPVTGGMLAILDDTLKNQDSY